ncbi:MAG: hypothetical protein N3D11_08730 [Candidatus Sumerlaeia bacterium]|nr:hypothetical protein [Candidatus Sumerlaeia bacterium]
MANTTPSEGGHRLVIDIGGGSTELIIGEGLAAKRLESLYMGCVSMSAQYFADGVVTEKRMKRARTAAQLEIEPVMARFRRSEWDTAFGASGRPHISTSEEKRSMVIVGVSETLPGCVTPGQWMIKGTRTPPS